MSLAVSPHISYSVNAKRLDVQTILGVLSYISKFIKNSSSDTSEIRELLKNDSQSSGGR